jgi:hypothetical protein
MASTHETLSEQERSRALERESSDARRRDELESPRPAPQLGTTPTSQARRLLSLQQTAGNHAVSAAVQRLRQEDGSRAAAIGGSGVVQREQFIGARGRHHMHIDIAQPHYKVGNSEASRINIGGAGDLEYRKEDLEAVIETVKTRLTESGAQACYDWCIAQARRIKAAARA